MPKIVAISGTESSAQMIWIPIVILTALIFVGTLAIRGKTEESS